MPPIEQTVRFVPDDGATMADLIAMVRAGLGIAEVRDAIFADVDFLKAVKLTAGHTLPVDFAGAETIAAEVTTRLTEINDSWGAACQLAERARRDGGKRSPASDAWVLERLDKLRRTHERAGQDAIRSACRRLWSMGRQAAGNDSPIGHDEKLQLQRLYRGIGQYYVNLLADTENGTGRMGMKQRIPMYGSNVIEAYWSGFVLADLSADRYLQWARDALVESCNDCVKLSKGGRWGKGIYTARELARRGLFPRSGKLSCCTHCGCGLNPVPVPTAKPIRGFTALRDIKIDGPSSSSFRGLGREGREALEKRAKKYGKWTHTGRTVQRGNPRLYVLAQKARLKKK